MVVDIGPLAGTNGVEIIFNGSLAKLQKDKKSLTAKYLNNEMKIEIPTNRRKWNNYIEIHGARENNLKNIDVKIPLNTMTVVTGVSGSGKSSLVTQIIYPAIAKRFGQYGEKTGKHDRITGDIHLLGQVEMVDQNPIGIALQPGYLPESL